MKAVEPLLRCHVTCPHPFAAMMPDPEPGLRLRCDRWLWHKGAHMAETNNPIPGDDGAYGDGLFIWTRKTLGSAHEEWMPITQQEYDSLPTGEYGAMHYGERLPGKQTT